VTDQKRHLSPEYLRWAANPVTAKEIKPMFELKVVSHFAAAHQLQMVAKKCENLHGHNWKVEVCVGGERLNAAGVLVDFGEIKTLVREIMKRLDHKFLNELECFDTES
jgi:6-pyruvoyltetrahydropterin/6-carboxytetrahydropterin synthase